MTDVIVDAADDRRYDDRGFDERGYGSRRDDRGYDNRSDYGRRRMIADMMTAAIMDVVTATAVTMTGLTPVPVSTVTLMVVASERLKSSGKYTLFVNNLIFFLYNLYIQNGHSNKNLRNDIRAYIIKFSNILSGL